MSLDPSGALRSQYTTPGAHELKDGAKSWERKFILDSSAALDFVKCLKYLWTYLDNCNQYTLSLKPRNAEMLFKVKKKINYKALENIQVLHLIFLSA